MKGARLALSRGGAEERAGGEVTTKAILFRARALIERGWCQGVDARDENGQRINPWNPGARSWSLLGALVTAEDTEADVVAHVELDQFARAVALLGEVTGTSSLQEWNDEAGRTHEQVLAVFDSAVVLLSSCESAVTR
jgi:hypothetical protein